jgi:hypothetical protein
VAGDRVPVVHSALPAALTRAAGAALEAAGVAHAAHGDADPMAAAEAAAGDARAVALIGPYRSADVAEAVEATAPVGLPLLAPVATWAGVTRDDEPGCEDDPADHRGTVLRMVARDTEVASRLAAHLRRRGERARLIAGRGEYGSQIEGQLRLAELPVAGDADVVVAAGVPEEPGMEAVRGTAPLPLVAFDGIQGLDVGFERDVWVVLPFAEDPTHGIEAARAARLVAGALAAGASTRAEVLAACRAAGPFDEHGDPVDPPVWLWRAAPDWSLSPESPLPG